MPDEFSRARSRPTCRSSKAAKIKLTRNLKTAKTPSLAVTLTLLGRADEVIE
jgi:hypothetical protein